MEKRPGIITGLLVGALLTAPVIALFYLADAVAGLPLIPTDAIDWLARNLPGGVITLGIDSIVSIINTFNLGQTDQVAKIAEQIIGIATVFLSGVVASGAAFLVLRRGGRAYPITLAAGLVLGVLYVLISTAVNRTATAEPALSVIWVVGLFAAWGAMLGWVYTELTAAPAKTETTGELDRRQFLVRVGGATATLTVLGAGLSAALGGGTIEEPALASTGGETAAGTPPPPPTVDSDVEIVEGTRPEYTPLEDHYRIDISIRPPRIDAESWTLPITGLVDNPITLTLNDLRENYESMDQIITMGCISNPVGGDLISTTRWTGVSFQQILDEIQVQPEGRFLRITCADGFDEYMDIEIAREDETVMLCYAWDGRPLLQKHGFPLRIHIPNRFGMKQPKWITAMEVVDEWQEGYWVRRGWSSEAIAQTTSVVDTVTTEGETVLVGGIAWAAARGISKVEVRVDRGEWEEAQLREPLSDRSWVLWRYEWPFEEGAHTFRVRCVDGEGNPQIETDAPVRPDGATGIHSVIERA